MSSDSEKKSLIKGDSTYDSAMKKALGEYNINYKTCKAFQ